MKHFTNLDYTIKCAFPAWNHNKQFEPALLSIEQLQALISNLDDAPSDRIIAQIGIVLRVLLAQHPLLSERDKFFRKFIWFLELRWQYDNNVNSSAGDLTTRDSWIQRELMQKHNIFARLTKNQKQAVFLWIMQACRWPCSASLQLEFDELKKDWLVQSDVKAKP